MKIFCKDKFLAKAKHPELYRNNSSWPDKCHDGWEFDTFMKILGRVVKVLEYSDFINLGTVGEIEPVGFKGGKRPPTFSKDSENTGLEMKSLEDGVSFKLTPANDVFEEMRKAIHQGIVDGVMNQPYDIHISSDGKTTTANFYVDGKIVRHAEAKCHPSDRFNFKTGAEVAFERLWEKKPEEKKSVDLNNLKPGDKVRVRKDLKAGSWPESILMVMPSMEKLAGKVVIIESTTGRIGDPIHTIKDFEEPWRRTPEMFEEV